MTARWQIVGNPDMIARVDVGTLPAWLPGPLGGLPASRPTALR